MTQRILGHDFFCTRKIEGKILPKLTFLRFQIYAPKQSRRGKKLSAMFVLLKKILLFYADEFPISNLAWKCMGVLTRVSYLNEKNNASK